MGVSASEPRDSLGSSTENGRMGYTVGEKALLNHSVLSWGVALSNSWWSRLPAAVGVALVLMSAVKGTQLTHGVHVGRRGTRRLVLERVVVRTGLPASMAMRRTVAAVALTVASVTLVVATIAIVLALIAIASTRVRVAATLVVLGTRVPGLTLRRATRVVVILRSAAGNLASTVGVDKAHAVRVDGRAATAGGWRGLRGGLRG